MDPCFNSHWFWGNLLGIDIVMIEGHFIARSQLIVKVTQVFIAFISLWVNGKLAKISVSSITSISSGQTNKSLQL